MPAATHQRLIDGSFADPADRYRCHVFEAVAALVLPEIIGGAIGAEALGATIGGGFIEGALGGGLGAAIGGATAPLTAGLGAALPAIGAVGSGLLDLGPELFGLGEAFSTGAGGLGDAITGGFSGGFGGPLTTGTSALSEAAVPAASAGTGVSGPIASAPALPAGVGELSPTATGILGSGPTGTAGGWPNITASEMGTGFGGNATAGVGTSGVTGAATGGSSEGFLGKGLKSLTGGAFGGGDLKDLGTVLSGGMMLKNLFGGDKELPGQAGINRGAAGLEATARGQAALGQQLQGFLQSGKLPPGVEQGLRSATSAAHASIKSQHAARGTSGSSAEAQEMQAANDRALAAGQQVAMQLLQQGSTMVGQAANMEGMASQLYNMIMADALRQDEALGQSIGNFSSALARSGGGNTGNTITLQAR